MTCREAEELWGAYALQALEADELARMERHIKDCAPCRLRVDELIEVASLLPYSVPAVASPRAEERLKSKILAQVRGIISPARYKKNFGARLRLPIAAPVVGTAVALFLIFIGWSFYRQNQELRNVTTAVEVALTCQEDVHLPGAPERPVEYARSWGRICSLPDKDMAVIWVADTPIAPEGSTYHLWFKEGERFRDAGVVQVGLKGQGWLITHKPENQSAVWVTLETTGKVGSKPNGPILIAKNY